MKNLLVFIFCAAAVFAVAFGVTEYLDGSSPLYISEKTDVYKFRDEQKNEDFPQFYEGEPRAELLDVLSKIERKNHKTRESVLQGDQIKYRIYLQNEKETYFIYLGEFNMACVEHPGTGVYGYEIINAEEIMAEIEALLEK